MDKIWRIRTQDVTIIDSDKFYRANPGTVTIAFYNQGSKDVEILGGLTISPGDPPVMLGGDPRFTRSDYIKVKFASGAGTQKLVIISDIRLGLDGEAMRNEKCAT